MGQYGSYGGSYIACVYKIFITFHGSGRVTVRDVSVIQNGECAGTTQPFYIYNISIRLGCVSHINVYLIQYDISQPDICKVK
jgi:hypothetical protein